MSDENKADKSGVNAENNSVAVGSISIGGNVQGNLTIGNTGFTSEEVSTLLTQITSTFQPKPFDGRCPYKGLDVFEEEDAELFFGREKLVDDLISRVKDSQTVFVTGPSGSGKSSMVRAGLIHALKQGAIKNSEYWLYATMKPGRDPLESLANAFSRLKSPELGNYFRQHVDQVKVLHECAESALTDNKNQRLVLFIDQFEEVFTQISKEEERVAFLNLLTHAATVENGRVIILFSMRSDFVSSCATYPQLNALLNQQFVQIGAMQPEELVSAIAQPALRVGLRIDPDLIAQIINEMKGEPGALPLMQFALKDLFDSQQEKSGVPALTLNDYLQRGGIHKALERHADDSFSKLSKNEQELARSIFRRLIEVGRGTQDTKRTALFKELITTKAKARDVEDILHKLADARLVTTDEQAGNDTVTISHEKLIDAWPWLRKLVNENRDVIALQNEISEDAKEWNEHKHDISYLYGGARLATAQEKIKNLDLDENAQAYIKAGVRVEENARLRSRRTQRRIITGLLVFSSIVLGFLILSLVQLNISRAQRLGFQSLVAFEKQNYNSALLYAYQSSLQHKNDAAELVLSQIGYKNFATGKPLIGHLTTVLSIAWSEDEQLATASRDGAIIIWDLKTGLPAQILKGHTGDVTSLAWSQDGQLASGSWDNKVIIWDLKTGKPAQVLEDTNNVTSVAWSTDGRLASGSWGNTVTIWDLNTSRPAQILSGHIDWVTSVAWSTNGQLVSGSQDNNVIIWDLTTGLPAQILKVHTEDVTSVAWSRDGQLASGSYDKTVIIWDLNTGEPAQTLRGHAGWVNSIAWTSNGQLVSGSDDKTVIIWDLKTNQPTQILKGHTGVITSVAWSLDGHLASGSWDNTVIAWEIIPDNPAQSLQGHTGTVSSVSWSGDGQLASGSYDKTVIVWGLETDLPAQILKGHTDPVNSIAWSTDGRLASGSDDNNVIIWDIKTGRPIQILKGHAGSVKSVAWSVDGQLASGSDDKTVIIWNLETGKPAKILKGHTDTVYSVAWSTDGQLASGSGDKNVVIWDIDKGQPIRTLFGHTNFVSSVAWSANGQLASGSFDNTVTIWNLKTGLPAQILTGHTGFVLSVAWSPDGHLTSGSYDNTVIVWDLKAGQPIQTLSGHTSSIKSIAWSSDGHLASGSSDNMVKIPRADLFINNLCNKILRNMTIQEWMDYQGMFYIYRPACSNLNDPTLNPTPYDFFVSMPITWIGRAIILPLVFVFLAIAFIVIWMCYRFAFWIWSEVRGSRRGI